MKDSKIDACVYILTCMLQRQEISQPGYLAELIEGVKGDWAGFPTETNERENIDAIFTETLSILNRAQQQLTGK